MEDSNHRPQENDGAVLWVHLDRETHAAFKAFAQANHVSMISLIRTMVRKVVTDAGLLEEEEIEKR